MTITDGSTESGRTAQPARARIGRPPKLSRDSIVAAARGLDRAQMSVTAVADALGVARNAVAYHVGGRDELVALVIESELEERLAPLEVPVDDWRRAIKVASEGMLDALVACGPAALAITRAPRTGFLGPSEQLLVALTRAGFSDAAAGRALALLSEVVYAAARYTLETEPGHGRPRDEELASVSAAAARRFPTFVRVFEESWTPREQLDFALEVIIAGLEASRAGAAD
ncbi:TetR/AcrR family transcriptional regulator C-terminal domain-containing protein [Demequina pelophila]|uniref:TetR/AcrR family transcriptional regulator C-terminal domain-containing protein n=1 Tax=Demequina pelophila TaxID=1638984 RepID=UPI00078333DE|nr:TetR/AcrR family transcriptional regulator C-terminal domain-containing protein [Demequina pelophila]